jgi:hypothetical protein
MALRSTRAFMNIITKTPYCASTNPFTRPRFLSIALFYRSNPLFTLAPKPYNTHPIAPMASIQHIVAQKCWYSGMASLSSSNDRTGQNQSEPLSSQTSKADSQKDGDDHFYAF